MHGRLPVRRRARGFSLLELLLVIVILAAVAWMATSTLENNVAQVRYDDTRNRLRAIREAVLGPVGPGALEAGVLSGYVVDNGGLPLAIDSLVEIPGGFGSFGSVEPVFDPVPDAAGHDNSDGNELTLTAAGQILLKGHRGGYLPASASGFFRDGWGNSRSTDGVAGLDCPSVPGSAGDKAGSDLDTANHGWCVTHYDNGFHVDSYGMDGRAGQLTGDAYETDLAMSPPILAGDWRTDVTGRSVQVANLSGGAIDCSNLRVSLLIYENSAAGARWRRLTTGLLAGSSLADGASTTATFPAVATDSTATNDVPLGEHLLLLVYDADGVALTSDDTPDVSSATGGASPQYVAGRVKFFSRGGVPTLKLEIR